MKPELLKHLLYSANKFDKAHGIIVDNYIDEKFQSVVSRRNSIKFHYKNNVFKNWLYEAVFAHEKILKKTIFYIEISKNGYFLRNYFIPFYYDSLEGIKDQLEFCLQALPILDGVKIER